MNIVQTVQNPTQKKTQKVVIEDTRETKYSILPKNEAIAMTAEVIDKYRPALEKLAE